jgi:tol-pal system protein YbgF
MRFRRTATFWCLGAILAFPGCASAGASGGDDLRSTVFATNRIVQDLDANLSGTVAKLSDTAATMTSRMDATDTELRQLSSMTVENQRKIERLQASLDSLTATLYRHFNLSAPQPTSAPITSAPAPSFVPPSTSGTVAVQPPSTLGQRPAAPVSNAPTEILPPLEGTAPAVSVTPPPVAATPAPVAAPAGADELEHYKAAQQLYAREDYAGAMKQFDEHIRMFPNGPNTANATYWKAHCSFRLNDYPAAIQGFDELRTKYPTSDKVPTAMHNQAVAYSRLGQNQRAIELFQQLIREYPDEPATESARAKLRQLQGQP